MSATSNMLQEFDKYMAAIKALKERKATITVEVSSVTKDKENITISFGDGKNLVIYGVDAIYPLIFAMCEKTAIELIQSLQNETRSQLSNLLG